MFRITYQILNDNLAVKEIMKKIKKNINKDMSTSYLSERSGLPYSCKLGKNFVPDAILVIEDYRN